MHDPRDRLNRVGVRGFKHARRGGVGGDGQLALEMKEFVLIAGGDELIVFRAQLLEASLQAGESLPRRHDRQRRRFRRRLDGRLNGRRFVRGWIVIDMRRGVELG